MRSRVSARERSSTIVNRLWNEGRTKFAEFVQMAIRLKRQRQ